MYHLKNLSRIAIPVFLFLAIASLFTTNALAQTSNLTVSPSVVVFSDTPVGAISYAEVTITNNGSNAEPITGAEPANAPLWATWGGTCNVIYGKAVPAGASCTFQWGFKPDRPGRVSTIGTISFHSGASLGVVLTGKGTK